MTIFARIAALLFENSRLELISKQFGVSVEDLEALYLPADPTKGKYLTWIMRQVKAGRLRFPEDQAKVAERLAQFDQFKKLKNWEGPRDINQYPSFARLAQDCFTAYHDGLQSNKARTRQLASEGAKAIAELVHEGEHWVVYEITTFEALDAMGAQQTEWCVKDQKYFNDYAKVGLPFHLATNDSGPQILLHLPTASCMDVWDDPCPPDVFEEAGIDCFDILKVQDVINRLEKTWKMAKGRRGQEALNSLLQRVLDNIAGGRGNLDIENWDVLNEREKSLVKVLADYYFADNLEPLDNAIVKAYERAGFESHLSTYATIREQRWPWYEQYLAAHFRRDNSDLILKLAVEYCKQYSFRMEALERALVDEMKADRVITNFNLAMRYWTNVGEGAWPEAEHMFKTILEEIKIGGGGPGASGHNLTVARNYAVKYNEMAGEQRIPTSVSYYT